MKNLKTALLALGVALASALAPVPASATLAVTPTSVVIEGRQRYADVTVINTSDTVDTYEMGWRYTRMKDGTGEYENVDASPTEFDLGTHMVFSPRRITLAPHASQKIRMALRLNGEPPAPGDYRAHLLLQQVGTSAVDAPPPPANGSTVAITMRLGITIPVVYRVGESDATAKIGQVTPRAGKSGGLELVVPIIKGSENYGVMGELSVRYDAPDGSKKFIGSIANAHLFRETRERDFVVPLKVSTLAGGALVVVYKDAHKDDVIYDQKLVPIGGR